MPPWQAQYQDTDVAAAGVVAVEVLGTDPNCDRDWKKFR